MSVGSTVSCVADLLGLVRDGVPLDAEAAEALLAATGSDLDALLELAGQTRDAGLIAAGRPGIITYSRKVFVPLTTLCRDRCHYCVFVDTPGQLRTKRKPAYLSPEQVLSVARQGQAMGCREVLLTLGDRPEDRWPEARAWLDEHGYASTLDYVAAIARLVTAETGLLAHANPGVMHAEELRMLRATAPSMGMMLETTSRLLFEEPGRVHFGSPDKDPDLRLRVIDEAGVAGIPFTTGILVGIGETLRDRAESLVAIRDLHERHTVNGQGHVQEIIVQNFRAKPGTAMRDAPDAGLLEYVAAVAVARLVFGPRMRVQVPPNLSDPAEFALLVRAGADDWGGISPLTADHVNPERPWPHLDDLARMTAELGFTLRERLTAQPEFVRDADRWIDPGLHAAVAALADPATGLAADVSAVAVQDPDAVVAARGTAPASVLDSARRSDVERLAGAAAADPLALDDAEWVTLLEATGSGLDALAATADDVRRYTVGEAVTLVVNRNLASSGFRAGGRGASGTYGLDDVTAIAADAADLGATEICVQGRLHPGEDPRAYLDIARAVKAGAPGIHLHAYRPQDVWDLADRGGLGLDGALTALRDAGVDSVPGTGVKVLSERVRGLVAPGDLGIDRWRAAIAAAHRAGFRSTSVLFYGHVETAAERIAHLRELRRIQGASTGSATGAAGPATGPATGATGPATGTTGPATGTTGSATGAAGPATGTTSSATGATGSATGTTSSATGATRPATGATSSATGTTGPATGGGGFTEFVPIALPGHGVPLVAGRAPLDEHRAMVAVSRLLLSGSIPHLQIPWTRVGRDAATELLRSGGDDLGGTLLDGRVLPDAGVEQGLELPVADATRIARHLFRPFRLRTTDYGTPTRATGAA